MARLRAAGNGSTQLSDRTYAFVACARNIGLWPHKQNHPPSGWFCLFSNRKSRQRLDRHGTIVVGSCETFHHYNVQGVK